MPNLLRWLTDKSYRKHFCMRRMLKERRLFASVQESFDRVVASYRRIECLLVELYELDNPQVKSLMDKYEVKITRGE